eukprot:TRINITY_DN10353_c0_g1_i3.p1 TRINITY_DN10353_c0_g1~~TRINITY_DN10353_c0_g1_i3.p1  ORF type:complete len:239 (-),score=23.65 TRINITY_DN10353_c0_g1_i3:308-1024(-)
MSYLDRNSQYSAGGGSSRPSLGYSSVPPQGSLGRPSGTPSLGRTSQQPNIGRTSVQKAQNELARRSEYPTQLNITLMIQEMDTGEAICYKSDGTRFQHSQETLKFREGEVYKILLIINPEAGILENLLAFTYVHDMGRSARDIVNLSFQALGNKQALSGVWKCTIQPTGDKQRLNMSIEFHVENFGVVEIPLCGKVYSSKERAYKSGFFLKSAVYTFRVPQAGVPGQKATLRTCNFIK